MTDDNARLELAGKLDEILSEFFIIPDPRSLDPELDASYRGTVQLHQANFRNNPTAPQAQFLEQMYVWVVTHQREQPAAENDLDVIVVQVTQALEQIGAPWELAERMKHPDGHHAYRITTTYITDKE